MLEPGAIQRSALAGNGLPPMTVPSSLMDFNASAN
jgi:hypothetical protein